MWLSSRLSFPFCGAARSGRCGRGNPPWWDQIKHVSLDHPCQIVQHHHRFIIADAQHIAHWAMVKHFDHMNYALVGSLNRLWISGLKCAAELRSQFIEPWKIVPNHAESDQEGHCGIS